MPATAYPLLGCFGFSSTRTILPSLISGTPNRSGSLTCASVNRQSHFRAFKLINESCDFPYDHIVAKVKHEVVTTNEILTKPYNLG